jgi:hypothetical protein
VQLNSLDIRGSYRSGHKFSGSLAAFTNCQQLNELDISYPQTATAIQGDIEYLPASLTKFEFSGNQKIAAKLYPYNDLVR